MIRHIIALTLAATSVAADPNDLTPDSGFVIGWTHHLNATPKQVGWTDRGDRVYADRFDEGLDLRGGGLGWDLTYGQINVSGYRQSIPDGGNGYTVAYITPALLADSGLSAHLVGQINYYPEMPTQALKDVGGVFATFGVSMRYEHESGAGVFLNVYPTGARSNDVHFDALYVAGMSWRF